MHFRNAKPNMKEALQRLTRLRRVVTPAASSLKSVLPASRFPVGGLSRSMSHKQVRFSGIRSFSESAAASVKKGREDNSNIFLDNLGKIFLTTIAGIVGALIRSSYNTSNRNALRDALEEEAALDPVEIDELRIANSELTADVFRSIVNDLRERFPDGNCSYVDFIKAVRRTMIQLKGEAFTIELGHQIDRVVAEVLLKFKKSDEEELPLSLWLVTLTLALNSSVADRLRILYELLQADSDPVRFHQIPILVGYLQDTCQLPPDTQLVPTDDKIPTQQWKKADPEELVPWEGSGDDIVDLDGFAAMLRSKSVCVWGECYQKKSFSSLHEKAK